MGGLRNNHLATKNLPIDPWEGRDIIPLAWVIDGSCVRDLAMFFDIGDGGRSIITSQSRLVQRRVHP